MQEKKTTSTDKIKRNITLKYLIAIGIIALLATLAFITLTLTIKEQEHTNYIVNLSGKQRMLSQHIALDVHRIHNDLVEHKMLTKNSLQIQKTLFETRIEEFLNANKALSSGKLPNGKTIILSKQINAMYFGDLNVSARVQQYAQIANDILHTTTHETIDNVKDSIDEKSQKLLLDLNKIVYQYQLEGEEKLSKLKSLELTVWIVTLFTLLMEVIFIFIPMTRRIVEIAEIEKRNQEKLKNAVKIKTLHLEDANKKLQFSASHDPLTGLKNRFELEKSQDNAIHSYEKNHAPYAVLMLDIDWFKKVNDNYGHDIGDDVLIKVAKIMQESVRENDKVFRAGGEEFVIILNRLSFDDSIKVAEKIRTIIENTTFKELEHTFSITISVGLFHSDLYRPKSHKDIIKLTDLALYESKSNGRNRLTVVNEKHISILQTKEDKKS